MKALKIKASLFETTENHDTTEDNMVIQNRLLITGPTFIAVGFMGMAFGLKEGFYQHVVILLKAMVFNGKNKMKGVTS